MNVLCNLAPLGTGRYDSRVRTGVYRVVEQLVLGLSASPECTCFFHAGTSLWHSRRYYEEHLRGPRSHFVPARWRTAVAPPLASLQEFVVRSAARRSLPFRAARFAAVQAAGRGESFLDRLPASVLRRMDIYHSPFLPIPAEVRQHPRVRRFTTIYDVIALTHPQFFEAVTVQSVRSVVDRLDERTHVACISAATRTALLAEAPRLDPARVFVTPLAAGPAFFPEENQDKIAAVRARCGLPPDAPYFLSLCTLEPRKNLEAVIRAFVRLKRSGGLDPETRLVLVGGRGWKTAKIFAALEEARECRDAIVLTGFVADEDLSALYSGALAFVYLSWQEGFGLPPLEAMQCGVPVVCSNTSSLPEVVGNAGILLAPDDLDGVAAAMSTLANDPDRRRALSARSLDRARLFSWERFVQQNLAAYRAALAGG